MTTPVILTHLPADLIVNETMATFFDAAAQQCSYSVRVHNRLDDEKTLYERIYVCIDIVLYTAQYAYTDRTVLGTAPHAIPHRYQKKRCHSISNEPQANQSGGPIARLVRPQLTRPIRLSSNT